MRCLILDMEEIANEYDTYYITHYHGGIVDVWCMLILISTYSDNGYCWLMDDHHAMSTSVN